MGVYLETKDGSKFDKARYFLEKAHSCERISLPEAREAVLTDELAVVCVVENGWFDAALLCWPPSELVRTLDPRDGRPRTYLAMPWEEAMRFTHTDPRKER